MRKTSGSILCLSLLLACSWTVTACAGGGEEAADEAAQAEWAWLQQIKSELDGKRAQLAELRAEFEAAPVPTEEPEGGEAEVEPGEEMPPEGEEAAPAEPSLGEQMTALEDEIAGQAEEFSTRLVNHINSLEIVQGEPLTPPQRQAIRMKSDEDIEVAKEWIEKGGDFRRAIDIYQMQLQYDPEYERLQEALDWAREMRYPTQERFDQLEKGMSRADVREALGPVNLHNIREYPEEEIIAWFYTKDPEEGGGAAGVYFKLDDEGAYTVYELNFEVTAEEEEAS